MVIQGQALQAQVQQVSGRLQPREGQGLREDEVSRREQRGQDGGQTVLAPPADQHLLRQCGKASAGDPGRARLTVRGVSRFGRIVEEGREVRPARQGAERVLKAAQVGLVHGRRREVLAQVHGFGPAEVAARGRGDFGPAIADERAPAHLARKQTPPRGLDVTPAHRSHRDTQPVRQVAVGGQPAARLELARGHVVGDRVRDREVPRAAMLV